MTRADVEAAKARGHTGAAAAAAAPGVDGTMFFPDFTDMPVKMVQKITAQRLLESKQTVPHYYLTVRRHCFVLVPFVRAFFWG